MQEVNLKKIIIFNLFYLHFCLGPQVCLGNSSFRFCALAWWCQKHHLTSHTHIILSQHFTNNFSLHTTR